MNQNCEKNKCTFSAENVLSDGSGGFIPCPTLLTEDEAIRFLRLDTVNIKNPSATLRRYREAGTLRAVQISKRIFYPRKELERFINLQMEKIFR